MVCVWRFNFNSIFYSRYDSYNHKATEFAAAYQMAKKKLPFGNSSIDMLHLYVLLYAFTKDHHQLTESVLNAADRQNFASAERMCDAKVTELLDKSVERSEGTSL